MTARTAKPAYLGRTRVGLAGAACAVALLAGCGSSTTGSPVVEPSGTTAPTASSDNQNSGVRPPFPTLTEPNLQPPKQHNYKRLDVAFDPCTWIDDGTMNGLGYSPQSRKRGTDINAEYTFLTCRFTSPDKVYSLSILSGNRTMDEGRSKYTLDGAQLEDTNIDGRAVVIVRSKPADRCGALLQTKAGYVDFSRIIAGHLIDGPLPERCSGMVDVVRAIIPRIGDN